MGSGHLARARIFPLQAVNNIFNWAFRCSLRSNVRIRLLSSCRVRLLPQPRCDLKKGIFARQFKHAVPQAEQRPIRLSSTLASTSHSDTRNELAVRLSNDTKVHLDPLLLRDSCSCPLCVDPSTRQKLFQTADIPETIVGRIEDHLTSDPDVVTVAWENDVPGFSSDHRTLLSRAQLHAELKDTSDATLAAQQLPPPGRKAWDRATMEREVVWLPYRDYMSDDGTLFDALEQLRVYGLVFLRGVPDRQTAVEEVAGRIGNLRDSFYGRTWDVRSVAEAKNIAYTHQFLGLHMDLLYMTNPPHLQLLHCLRASSPGGASLFSDALHAAVTIHTTHPSHFHSLATFPVPYHYHNAGQHYYFSRPTIQLSEQQSLPNTSSTSSTFSTLSNPSQISHINYSPPFQAPFPFSTTNPSSSRAYHSAIKLFAEHIESPAALFEYRLREGECVIFDNRRVLHARRAFDASQGERWLKGAYVDGDVFWSRWRVLRKRKREEHRDWMGP